MCSSDLRARRGILSLHGGGGKQQGEQDSGHGRNILSQCYGPKGDTLANVEANAQVNAQVGSAGADRGTEPKKLRATAYLWC